MGSQRSLLNCASAYVLDGGELSYGFQVLLVTLWLTLLEVQFSHNLMHSFTVQYSMRSNTPVIGYFILRYAVWLERRLPKCSLLNFVLLPKIFTISACWVIMITKRSSCWNGYMWKYHNEIFQILDLHPTPINNIPLVTEYHGLSLWGLHASCYRYSNLFLMFSSVYASCIIIVQTLIIVILCLKCFKLYALPYRLLISALK